MMSFLDNLRLRQKLLLGFAVPVLLIALLSTVINYSLGKLNNAFHWVEHTHTAINYGDRLLSSMIDMETGLRGYMVAGDPVFLEPYEAGNLSFYETLSIAKSHVSDNPTQVDRLNKIESLKKSWNDKHAKVAIALRQEVASASTESLPSMADVAEFIGLGLGKQSMDSIRDVVAEFNDAERMLIDERAAQVDSISSTTSLITIGGALIALISSALIVLLITRNIGRQLGTEPSTVSGIAQSIAAGDLTQDISSEKPATGVLAAMQTMQSSLIERSENDSRIGEEMARIKQALDSASSAVLVTDESLRLIYQNKSAATLFQSLEADLQHACSGFKASELIGSDFTSLLTSDCVSRAHLEQLQAPLQQNVRYGTRSLSQVISPIICGNGSRIGIVVEWRDRTDQLSVESEMQGVVDAALEGDLSQRLKLEGKDGFLLMLGERMNSLVEICENVVNDTVRMFGALSSYNLTESITADYKGSFSQVKDNANQTVLQLQTLIEKVKSDASLLDTASSELSDLNRNLYDSAEVSSDQVGTVSAAAEQVSANINGVASASTQMSASINEIARNAADATKIAGEAVKLAESTETTVRQLSASSNDIGNVIKVINSIAEQTNLLALNATIEAARAGDAGKGFAVVANEVKELAKETAKATEEIGQKVATIQTDSESAVEAIGGIDSTIQKINDIQVMIASAVQQQTATTNEISRSVNEAADSSSEIAENSSKAADGTMQALNRTLHAQQSTKELAQLASELNTLVDQFKLEVA
jgi:methyl-accepting chemotaxis protein